jgi:hypothetical protein
MKKKPDENHFTDQKGNRHVIKVVSTLLCDRCSLYQDSQGCADSPACTCEDRADRKTVIFVLEKPKK